ncbi:hypothetical protein FISHEDRAFT_73654 [Fistulina hepatica ATCC 64428]|uniref:Uncharacterized protein n=1 Tax=Fistulina hepatica ATCC 64428 TaxID=1128425 RepID=A0A0D7AC91_9AGAR|nr:hypothetical protein FISHEDRAFT_73654 [Fistulina hepatica ATCC 64428]
MDTPPLSASHSNSNSSNSPPPPVTPVHNRGVRRYPSALSTGNPHGHVPLHRRGRSHTYECLEDLLREAGYKETRVFTPETERVKSEPERSKGSVRSMVNFLSGLLPGPSTSNEPLIHSRPTTSHPASKEQAPPLQRKREETRSSDDTIIPVSPKEVASTLMARHVGHPRRPPSHLVPPGGGTVTGAAGPHQPPSRATAYLRHMASTPNLPARRPRRSMWTSADLAGSSRPHRWVETVARAILAGPRGADVAAEPATPSATARARHPNRRPDLLRPAAVGVVGVSQTSVLCRSAPASRNSSAVRGRSRWREPSVAQEELRVPSLARTHTQGDAWVKRSAGPLLRVPARFNHGDLSGSSDESDASCDEEDDSEVDLTLLLVPSKGRNSIRSLRRHLAGPPPFGMSRPRRSPLNADFGYGAGSAVDSGCSGQSRQSINEDDEQEQREWGPWAYRGLRTDNSLDSSEDEVFSELRDFVGLQRNTCRGRLNGNASSSRKGLPRAWRELFPGS